MNIAEMNIAEIEARSLEIAEEIKEASEERLAELKAEAEQIATRKQELAEAEQRAKTAEAINNGEVAPKIKEERKEEIKMEIRNTREYIDAYAQYVKTGNDAECRALLSENATSGTIAVPDMVVATVQTAWDNEPILALCKKTFMKGNVKIGFEISADGAVVHTEGGEAVAEEELVIGTASLVPESIKKWISISDEALDLAGEAFLNYIYAELGYQIAKKLADEIIADVVATTASGSATVPAQAIVNVAPSLSAIATAVANLSDEATNPTVVMNKLTYAVFKRIQNAANYAQDVFDGLKVVFNNSLPAYDTASTNDTYAIVGDFGRGEMVNFPAGQEITFKFDDKSLMTADLVKVLGRMYAGHAVVAPHAFTKLTKPAQG